MTQEPDGEMKIVHFPHVFDLCMYTVSNLCKDLKSFCCVLSDSIWMQESATISNILLSDTTTVRGTHFTTRNCNGKDAIRAKGAYTSAFRAKPKFHEGDKDFLGDHIYGLRPAWSICPMAFPPICSLKKRLKAETCTLMELYARPTSSPNCKHVQDIG